ncbi:hypothetical protein GGP41_009023 [Bipolaris sorokiniana]|uniref:Uncharacterized protein n=1 Tax=Cochliobolus sativus TaxID=45130 RepID=A0A8H5ZFJ3_COCSA|nr:hypothetical protein GGP41_009023 [Bipolaris sorokiniana]
MPPAHPPSDLDQTAAFTVHNQVSLRPCKVSFRIVSTPTVLHIVSAIHGLASQVLRLLFVPQDATASGAQAASVASPKRQALGVKKGVKASSFPKTHQTKQSPMQCLLAVPAVIHAGESGHRSRAADKPQLL